MDTVILPNGTEVTTTVAVTTNGVVRARGALGRIAQFDGARYLLKLVDGATVWLTRHELAPHRVGQVQYAARRAAHWRDLAPTIVLEATVGSRAWGLADAGSDTDKRGVFVLPLAWTTGLRAPPHDLLSDDGTSAYWEIAKTVQQGLRADPNTLEMFFAEPRALHPLGEMIIAMRDAFVSQAIYGAFGRYALSQLKRLVHNERLAAQREVVLHWLAKEALTIDEVATRLVTAAQIEAPTPTAAHVRAKEYLKQLYRSIFDMGLLGTNDWAGLVAAARNHAVTFPPPRDVRPKNAYNLIRLLDEGIRWLRGEPLTVRVSDALRSTLWAIKRGEVPMPEVLKLAETMTPQLEAARAQSPLPLAPDYAAAEGVLRAVRLAAARSAVMDSADAWGRFAVAPAPIAADSEAIAELSENTTP